MSLAQFWKSQACNDKNEIKWEDIHSPTPKSNRPKPLEKITKKGFTVGHPTLDK